MRLIKGLGMGCRCGLGKRCRYNKAQWKSERRSIYRQLKKKLIKEAKNEEEKTTIK